MNERKKPVSLIRDELVDKIVTAINESGLSYFVLEYILKDILIEIHNGAVKQAEAEKTEYLKTTQVKNDTENETENATK